MAEGDISRTSSASADQSQPAVSRAKRGIKTACSSSAIVSRGKRSRISSTTACLSTLDMRAGTAMTTLGVEAISSRANEPDECLEDCQALTADGEPALQRENYERLRCMETHYDTVTLGRSAPEIDLARRFTGSFDCVRRHLTAGLAQDDQAFAPSPRVLGYGSPGIAES